jgi:hypothetical protein
MTGGDDGLKSLRVVRRALHEAKSLDRISAMP